MNAFYEVNGAALRKEFDLLRNPKEVRRFQAHPKRIRSDSDSTGSDSSVSRASSARLYRNRKELTIKESLHEKLSFRNPSPSGDATHRNDERYRLEDGASSASSSDLDSFNVKNNAYKTETGSRTTITTKTRRIGANKVSSPAFSAPGIPDSVFEKKFKVICEKSLQSVIDIRSLLTKGVCPPDGDEDIARRITRVKEFSNRFGRNYLYPLARKLKELTQQQHQNVQVFNRKMLAVYQIVLHAIQAYQSHLPTSIGTCAVDQLRILMGHVVELCVIHRRYVQSEDNYLLEFIDTFKINAELTEQKIGEFLNHPVPSTTILKSESTRASLNRFGNKIAPSAARKRIGDAAGKKTGADKRFSMYTATASFRKDAPWKRAVETLAKKKFQVKSRYKTATYKHRPPVQKCADVVALPKLKLGVRKKIETSKRTPTIANQPANEDQIATMVECCEERESGDLNNQCTPNKEELLAKLLQWTLKNKDANDDVKANLSRVLDLAKEMIDRDGLKRILDQDKQQLTLEIVDSRPTVVPNEPESEKSNKKKDPKIVVSGAKNARLICITDDNSVIETRPEHRTASETQTDIETVTKATQKGINGYSVKISRLRKPGRQLQPLEKSYAVSVIQYKIDFYKYRKNDPMYRRSTNCQPCIVMGKISDDILNQLIMEVANEIEANDIVDKVYLAEFHQ